METKIDNDIEIVNEALLELTELKVIIGVKDNFYILDIDRLHCIGFILIYECNKLKFVKLKDLRFIQDPIFNITNIISKETLLDYKCMSLYETWTSH